MTRQRASLAAFVLLLPVFLLACTRRSAAQSDEFVTIADIAYASIASVDPNLLSLDLYLPLGEGPFPLIIYIHGGGWALGDKTRVQEKPAFFTRNGFAFASVNYRLSPFPVALDNPERITFPTHPDDVGMAVGELLNSAEIHALDPNNITLMGHSAGGHLAALVASDPSYLQAVGKSTDSISCVVGLDAAGYDIPYRLQTSDDQIANALFVNAFTTEVSMQTIASPISHISSAAMPRFLLVHQDTADRIDINLRYANALDAAGQVATLYKAGSLGHDEINQLLGTLEQADYSAAVLAFVNQCRSVPTVVQLQPQSTVQNLSSSWLLLIASLLAVAAVMGRRVLISGA